MINYSKQLRVSYPVFKYIKNFGYSNLQKSKYLKNQEKFFIIAKEIDGDKCIETYYKMITDNRAGVIQRTDV